MGEQRRPASDEPIAGLDVPTGTAGYAQTAVTRAIEAALLDDRDKGTGALAIACARAVDLAQARRDPYAIAGAARELRETLTALRMTPASRDGADAGGAAAWLESLQAEQVD